MAGLGLRRREVGIVALGLAVSMVSWLSFQPWRLTDASMIGAPFGRDFVNFWMAPRLVLAGEAAMLADLPAYNAAIREAFGYTAQNRMVFSYPPHALLALLPFGLMPYLPALLAWTALNLAALAAAARLVRGGRSAPRFLAVAVCLSPAAAAMVTYGHFGGFLALGATAAILEAERRPHLAGFCLGALSIKPQFAALLGLVLVLGGHWRWIPSALAGTASLVALSVAAFGIGPWERFVGVTVPFQTELLTDFVASMISTTTSLYVTARVWGLASEGAWALQATAALLAVAAAAHVLRSGSPGPRHVLVTLLAVLVALPYANHYDLAILVPALTPLVLDRGVEPSGSPVLAALWLLAPLAKILWVFSLPIVPLVMAAALLAETLRHRAADDIGDPASRGALPC